MVALKEGDAVLLSLHMCKNADSLGPFLAVYRGPCQTKIQYTDLKPKFRQYTFETVLNTSATQGEAMEMMNKICVAKVTEKRNNGALRVTLDCFEDRFVVQTNLTAAAAVAGKDGWRLVEEANAQTASDLTP